MDRRAVLLTSAVWALHGFAVPGASAQASAIADAKKRLMDALPLAFPKSGQFQPGSRAIGDFLRDELSVRAEFIGSIGSLPEAVLLSEVDPDAADLVASLQKNQIPLLPKATELRPLPGELPGSADDTLADVVLDILVGTLKLDPIEDALFVIFTEYPPINELLDQLREAIGARDLGKVVDLFVQFVRMLIASELFNFLVARFGADQATNVVAAVLKSGTRMLVPFFGWALLAGSFASVVYENWDRLLRAYDR